MTIKVWVNEVGGGWSPFDDFLRGTEEFVREFAVACRRMGHTVSVYHNGAHGTYEHAYFLPHSAFTTDCDYLLVVKEAILLDRDLSAAKRIVYWTNDVDDKNRLTPRRLAKVEKVIAISEYHRNTFLADVPKVEVIGHGIYPERYRPNIKERGLCLYASSPDRGLEELLQIWPSIERQFPHAKLEIAYNGRSEEAMDDLFRRAEFWVYPCKGTELFCIAGLKAQAAGCIPVIIPHMALAETVKFGFFSGSLPSEFEEALAFALSHPEESNRVAANAKTIRWPTHDEIAYRLLAS